MSSSNLNFSLLWQKYAQLVAKVLAALLALLALYFIAKMIWLWVDYAQPKTILATSNPNSVNSSVQTINANKIAQMHLFGAANQTAEPVEEVVGETHLNLKLLGVYVDSDELQSSAIIKTGGNKEKVYWIGDKLEGVGASQVSLKRVEPLKVIINNNGRNETLTLLEKLNEQVIASVDSNKKEADNNTNGKTIDKRRDSRLTKDLTDMRNKLAQSPQSYAGLARFEPVVDNAGQIAGFKVAPGKDPRMFSRLGLRRNDVVKSINGQGLSNDAYWTALKQLRTAETLEISIERNGQPVTLLLNLGANNSSQKQNIQPEVRQEIKIQ